ncbi:MAG: hypothetical protein LUI85_02470 [Bacteroides sp.]|jgi:hypothetical protein|nr:hypothetical protein [Bacteroides sp.]DAU03328.1 MAG TPA: hypothetical protein [Caudoviricetes sp.]
MKGDLLINGKDAFDKWGVNMGDNFLNALLMPPPVKDYIENKSRLENGKRLSLNNEKVDERDLNLTFTIQGDNQVDYISKFKEFMAEMVSGLVEIKIPILGNDIYRVYYKNATSYAMSVDRTFSKIAMKVCEPNPSSEGRK